MNSCEFFFSAHQIETGALQTDRSNSRLEFRKNLATGYARRLSEQRRFVVVTNPGAGHKVNNPETAAKYIRPCSCTNTQSEKRVISVKRIFTIAFVIVYTFETTKFRPHKPYARV